MCQGVLRPSSVPLRPARERANLPAVALRDDVVYACAGLLRARSMSTINESIEARRPAA